jgi:hypothetical protein
MKLRQRVKIYQLKLKMWFLVKREIIRNCENPFVYRNFKYYNKDLFFYYVDEMQKILDVAGIREGRKNAADN